MKNHYEKEVNLTSTYSDRRCELGIFQAALLLQDAMTELFHQYRCDAIRLARASGGLGCGADENLLRQRNALDGSYPVKSLSCKGISHFHSFECPIGDIGRRTPSPGTAGDVCH